MFTLLNLVYGYAKLTKNSSLIFSESFNSKILMLACPVIPRNHFIIISYPCIGTY